MNYHLKIFIIGFIALILPTGCSTVWNGEADNLSVAEVHPISVDSQVVTLTIDVDPTIEDLSTIDQARIKAFAFSYLQKGHGPLTVTAPSGGADDRVAQEVSADIRQYLYQIGVPYESMTGASYRANGQANERQLVLSYTHYVATPSPCGVWTSEFKHAYKNLTPPNFGCADQNNLAAMIADPRDLIIPADGSAPDAPARVRAIEAFRNGEVTSSATDGDIDASVNN